jgi:starch phosphorylase
VFLPNFNVTSAQRIYPAADVSEQISLAGKEASGTGNMKFAMNGSLTVGTMDGANIELCDAIGADNFFSFGLTTGEVNVLKASGYAPAAYYQNNAQLRAVIDLIHQGFFSRGDHTLFRPLFDEHLQHDPYLLLADFASYMDCQERVSNAFRDSRRWQRMSVLSCARSGRFSSDRAIREYCERIWKAGPVPVQLLHRAAGGPRRANPDSREG